jgi:choice-of-anchor B domain-containing protein
MKKIVLLSAVVLYSFALDGQTPCVNGFAGEYPCELVDLVTVMSLTDIEAGQNTNDIWGWVSPITGNEYALVGTANGTSFVDITNPLEPVHLGFLPTHTTPSLWRDVEAYNNYAFVGSEAGGHGLQIMNLLQLDNVANPPVVFEEDAWYGGFGNSHTINIDPASGILMALGSGTFNGGPHIVDVQDPLNPALLGGFDADGYTHDGFLLTYNGPDADKQGKLIAVLCNEDALTVADCTDPQDCILIDTYTYPQTGYVHQGWFTKDLRYFLVNDELDEMNFGNGTRTHMFDLQDLDNLEYLGFHESENPSIDHNLYIQDQFVYESNYRSGVRIFDASRVADSELHPVGYFDLFPANDDQLFSGTWSNYPFLPSGVNIATSMYTGFFILDPNILELTDNRFSLCGVNEIGLEINALANLQYPLTVNFTGLPDGAQPGALVINEPGTYPLMIGNLNAADPGLYECIMQLETTFGEAYELPFDIVLSSGVALSPVLAQPVDGAQLGSNLTSYLFTWDSQLDAVTYQFQLAADASFSSIIEQQNTTASSFQYPTMLPEGVYYWRVAAVNSCGSGPWSAVNDFSVIPVGVGELTFNAPSISPNPATELVMIKGLTHGERYDVVDMTGRTCATGSAPHGNSLILDIRALSPGIYFLRTDATSTKLVKK